MHSSKGRLKLRKLHAYESLISENTACFLKKSLRCTCLINLVSSDAATASGWLTIADQVLLVGSVFLTYMAGVVPIKRPGFTSHRSVLTVNSEPGTTSMSGR